MQQTAINVVWLKRDLRWRDHAPLAAAAAAGLPVLVVYCFEPALLQHPDYTTRHWRFVYESLRELRVTLQQHGAELLVFQEEVVPVLNTLQQHFQLKNIFSHLEVGLELTFKRDKAVKQWCRANAVAWQEFGQDGVIRGQKHRRGWQAGLENHLQGPLIHYDPKRLQAPAIPAGLRSVADDSALPAVWRTPAANFQPGGESYAWRYLQSFFQERSRQYSKQLSKPALSRHSCSRLSPYLAYGNLSVRQVYQATLAQLQAGGDGFNLKNFKSRLYWRSHFLQKLESGHYLEHRAINPGLENLGRTQDEIRWQAFVQARTGYPMIDASLRCLAATGWVNFRMRAMLVSFATFTLWLDWKPVAQHLAGLFLDFEPGIHYAQIQMQAGLTGYNTLRVYNPNTQAEKHDPMGEFIHRWLPELRTVPAPWCHRPWQMTAIDEVFYQCAIGQDYPHPIVDFEQETRRHKDRYWAIRQSPEVRAALPELWRQFCMPGDVKKYQREEGRSAGEAAWSGG
ncbi:MAG: deoxyribodipyrimidine photolyase [Bacteroidetes bacterium]|nr:MAG: deoxyribodipyrimidine photolyase [Bacteroidota bacterium]PTM13170.1 MAG: deoxyribodipyrimidine photolyase [Bacteroidota bacterium]